MKKTSRQSSSYWGRTFLLPITAIIALSLCILPTYVVFAATSCSPGLASVIGTEYVANKCPWEGSTYNYYGTDLECVNGSVQRDSMSSGDQYIESVTPQYMQSAILSFAQWYSLRVFRDTPGTRFVLVDQYFARGGGKINGISVGNYPIAPTVNYDVFKTVLYKNPNATVPCCLKITSFTAAPQTIKPSLGETTTLSASIYSNFDITWTLTVADRTIPGEGTSANYTWDGKDKTGRNLPPGTYTATLTANSNGCITSATVGIAVVEPVKATSCPLNAPAGSSANVAGGNLTFSQDLFATKGGALSALVSLSYDSLDSRSGTLGQSWSHNYDISVQDGGNNSILLRQGGDKRLYTFSGGVYVPQNGDYSTLVKNADGTVVMTEKDGMKYNFDQNGKITSIADRNGNTMTFAYTAGNLTSLTDAGGRVVTISYDGNNKISTITDPNGNGYSFTYSGNNLASINNPDGGVWAYTYDVDGFLLTRKDPDGNVITYIYNSSHRLTSSIDPNGRTRSLSYPTDTTSATRSTTFTEKDGGEWIYTYDVSSGTLKSKTDPNGNATSYTYDNNQNLLTKTEPVAGTTTYTYDTAGNMLTTTDPLSQTTTYTYNSFGQVLSMTDPVGSTTTNTYDDKGNLTQTVDPLGAKTVYIYDLKGNPLTITNALNQTTTFTYDAANNLTSAKDPMGSTTTFTYDTMGDILTQTDAAGNSTRFIYDTRNRLTKTTDAQGGVTSFTYDANGNRMAQTDANGNTTTFSYDYQGQLISTKDPQANVTAYTYGGTGCASCGGVDKLTSVSDANGNTTRYEYDLAGRLVRETDPKGNAATYTYDGLGRLLTRTDGKNQTTTYIHDAIGRLITRRYPDGTSDSFTYDANGKMLTAGNGNINYTLTYDAGGRLTGVTDTFGRTISYLYDKLGNRTQMTAPDGRITTYSYDASNHVTGLAYGAKTFGFRYDRLGRRYWSMNPDGSQANYSYDNLNRVRRLFDTTSIGQPITYYLHTYDKTGNRLTRAELKQSFTYSYDPLYRLMGTTSSVASRNEAYTYDPVGNRLTGPATATRYSYASANELTGKTGATYQYDNNGNLVGKTEGTTAWTYGYDFQNHLTSVTEVQGSSTSTINFKYDPFGRRIEKSVNDGSTVTTTRYLYDGENILYEYDGGNTITTRYVHDLGIDNPLGMERNGIVYSYHKDALGSVIAITENTARVIQSYDYDSFGNIVAIKDPAFVQPYTYTGREFDGETGLYYYRARYYDPMVGRFVSKDPIGFDGGDVNLFAYVANSPINRADPTGLKWVWFCKARLGSGGSARNTVASLYPFFGHCYIKFGDDARGFYTGYYEGSWGSLPEDERTLIINRWCRPSWVSDCKYECLKKNTSVGTLGASNGGSSLSNNCCTNLAAKVKECEEKCCGK